MTVSTITFDLKCGASPFQVTLPDASGLAPLDLPMLFLGGGESRRQPSDDAISRFESAMSSGTYAEVAEQPQRISRETVVSAPDVQTSPSVSAASLKTPTVVPETKIVGEAKMILGGPTVAEPVVLSGNVGRETDVSLVTENPIVGENSVIVENKPVKVENKPVAVEDDSSTIENNQVTFGNETVTVGDESVTVGDESVTVENKLDTVENKPIIVENKPVIVETKTTESAPDRTIMGSVPKESIVENKPVVVETKTTESVPERTIMGSVPKEIMGTFPERHDSPEKVQAVDVQIAVTSENSVGSVPENSVGSVPKEVTGTVPVIDVPVDEEVTGTVPKEVTGTVPVVDVPVDEEVTGTVPVVDVPVDEGSVPTTEKQPEEILAADVRGAVVPDAPVSTGTVQPIDAAASARKIMGSVPTEVDWSNRVADESLTVEKKPVTAEKKIMGTVPVKSTGTVPVPAEKIMGTVPEIMGTVPVPIDEGFVPKTEKQPEEIQAADVRGVAVPEVPVSTGTVQSIDAAASVRTVEIVETVEKIVTAVTEQIEVVPSLVKGEETVIIHLKPEVLDGSEISMSAKDGVLTLEITPATPQAAVIVEKGAAQLERALTEHVTVFQAFAVVVKKGKFNETR